MFANRVKTCYYRLIVFSLLSFVLTLSSFATSNDTIYQGTQIKLDIASPIIISAANKWKIQHYEIGANVRLKDRFYPTLELGYSGGTAAQGDSIGYTGQGGFFRVGCDINPLKKHPESPHALLVGVRLGTAVQNLTQTLERNTASTAASTGPVSETAMHMQAQSIKGDCWGEIVIGCQVEIAKVQKTAFYMGWMGRLKCLFTRYTAPPLSAQEDGSAKMIPIYIPGFGTRDNIGWGVNYYLGWRF